MLDYQKLYKIIFNGITDAIECMETGAGYLQAKETLVKAQQAAEEYFISEEDDGAADESAANLRALPGDPCQDPKTSRPGRQKAAYHPNNPRLML